MREEGKRSKKNKQMREEKEKKPEKRVIDGRIKEKKEEK